MTQSTIFDVITAQELGKRGIGIAAENNARPVTEMQQLAIEIGRRQRFVSINHVNRAWVALGRRREEIGNGAGSIFRSRKHWRRSGRDEAAEHIKGHGRRVPVWEYVGKEE